MYKISNTIYLDKISNCYKKIFTLSPPPNNNTDPFLCQQTKLIHNPKLSPYKDLSPCCDSIACIYAFKDPDSCCCELLCEENIEKLYSMLIENNYDINIKLTKLTKISNVKSKNLVCFIKKIN